MAENRYSINAVDRSFRILDMMTDRKAPVSLQEVSEELDVSTNMAFRLLASLESSGYVQRDLKSGFYTPSLRVLKLAYTALQGLEINKLAMPCLELLWSQFPKANVNMGMKHGDDILMIDRVDGKQLPRTYFTPGRDIPFHCTGLGKVLCSQMKDEDVLALIERKGLKAYTERTITDPDKLLAELHKVLAEGVGRDRCEYIADDNCSAVPIFDAEGNIAAAISTSALSPNMSVDEIEATIPKLKETANRISGFLGYRMS